MPLGELLVREGLITRDDLQTALARKMGYPQVDLEAFPIDVEALRKLPVAAALRLRDAAAGPAERQGWSSRPRIRRAATASTRPSS